jgi:GntR family transcriptional regulator
MLDWLHIQDNGVPIYVQIRDQILGAVGAGVLKPGDRLPTMREVAVALRVDLNTVRRGYEAAQEAGVIVLVKARGTFVAEHPPADANGQSDRVEKLAHQAIALARAGGIDPGLLAQRITEITRGG